MKQYNILELFAGSRSIGKEAEKQGLEIININVKKFLRQVERQMKHRKKEKESKNLSWKPTSFWKK